MPPAVSPACIPPIPPIPQSPNPPWFVARFPPLAVALDQARIRAPTFLRTQQTTWTNHSGHITVDKSQCSNHRHPLLEPCGPKCNFIYLCISLLSTSYSRNVRPSQRHQMKFSKIISQILSKATQSSSYLLSVRALLLRKPHIALATRPLQLARRIQASISLGVTALLRRQRHTLQIAEKANRMLAEF